MRVLSYNIRDGGRWRLARIAGIIRQADPDVVALLEATSRTAVLLHGRNFCAATWEKTITILKRSWRFWKSGNRMQIL